MVGFYFILVLFSAVCALSYVAGDEDTKKCIKDMVEWCNNQDYTYVGHSLVTYTERINDQSEHVQCISTSRNGTRCTRNGYFWYSCLPNHTMTYKNTTLRKHSRHGADGEICYTASRLNKGDEISAEVNEEMDESKTKLDESMKKLDESMRKLDESMKKMRQKLGRKCFPFCREDSSDESSWSR